MAVKKIIVRPYPPEDKKEHLAFEALGARLESLIAANDEVYLFANANIDGAEIDAIVLAPNSLMVIDFKSYSSGTVQNPRPCRKGYEQD